MYRFQALREVSLQQLAECFNSAFSDYEQSICFTPESLKYYLTASAVDLSLSYGAFCGEQMVAFILNAGGIYQNQSVVFDAGTGVIPGHRGKKVFSQLFAYAEEQLRQRGVEKYCLEVLQSNRHAVAIYRKKGFAVCREYSVLTATGPGSIRNAAVAALPYGEFDAFLTRFSAEPSFEHTTYILDQNPRLYEVLCLPERAYCIFAKRNGEINQLHYNDPDGLKDVLSALTHRYPSAMAKNIDCGCRDVMQALEELGFAEITKQYEMVKELRRNEM